MICNLLCVLPSSAVSDSLVVEMSRWHIDVCSPEQKMIRREGICVVDVSGDVIASWAFPVVSVCKCVIFSATESGCLSIIVVKSPCHVFHFMGSPVKGSFFIFGCDIGNVEICGGFETVGCCEDDVF